jgi:thiamine pyrophosphokinase
MLTNYLNTFNTDKMQIIGPILDKFPQLDSSLPILAIDGGADFLSESEHYFHIGDGDSSQKLPNIKLDEHKDFSDLDYALGEINFPKIEAYGFLGERSDHELLNINSFYRYSLKNNAEINLYNKNNQRVWLIKRSPQIESEGLFSLICLEENQVEITGDAKYKTNQVFKPLSSLGLSNWANGVVRIKSQKPVLIYFGR